MRFKVLLSMLIAVVVLCGPAMGVSAATLVSVSITPTTLTAPRSSAVTVVASVTPASAGGVGFRGTVQWAMNGRGFASTPVIYDPITDTATVTLTTRLPPVPGTAQLTGTFISGSTQFTLPSWPNNMVTCVITVT